MGALVWRGDPLVRNGEPLTYGEDNVATLYPDGYGSRLVSLSMLIEKHSPKMHPEFRHRLFRWIESKGGLIGIGGGWRPTPDPVSTASQQGKSFHQDQLFASGFVGYAAVDLVARNPGNVHRAPTWAETADGPNFGVHTFIKSPSPEPWHMQCVEMRGWQTWVDAGRPDPVATVPDIPEVPPMSTLAKSIRLVDTRDPSWQGGKPAARSIFPVIVPESKPAWANAAIVRIGVDQTEGPGFLSAWNGVGDPPGTSCHNYVAGSSTGELTHVPMNGRVFSIFTLAATHLTVDLVGWDSVA